MNAQPLVLDLRTDTQVARTGQPVTVEATLYRYGGSAESGCKLLILVSSDEPANIAMELTATTDSGGVASVMYSRAHAGFDTIQVVAADHPNVRARSGVQWKSSDVSAVPAERPVKVFCSYAHEDTAHRDQLLRHAAAMLRTGKISAWHDGLIVAGQRWRPEIYRQLEESDIVVTLISSDFLASDFCVSVELRRAFERSSARELLVIPCIVRPCDWHPILGDLHALPLDGRPITSWPDRDEAYLDVIRGLRQAANALRDHRGTAADPNLQFASTAGRVIRVSGTVVDDKTGTALADVCVTIGPPIRCFTRTDADGRYQINLGDLGATPGQDWDFYYLQDGYLTTYSGIIKISGPTVVDVRMRKR